MRESEIILPEIVPLLGEVMPNATHEKKIEVTVKLLSNPTDHQVVLYREST